VRELLFEGVNRGSNIWDKEWTYRGDFLDIKVIGGVKNLGGAGSFFLGDVMLYFGREFGGLQRDNMGLS